MAAESPRNNACRVYVFYAVFEVEKQSEIKSEVSIRNFVNSLMTDYRTTITFTTTVDNMPEGATII